MNKSPTALIIDDDPDSLSLLEYRLTEKFPDLRIETRTVPDPHGHYDLYFIDNDFQGQCLASELAAAIRHRHPASLVVAFSARLDARTLKRLLNEGCDGACDKSDPEDLQRLIDIVDCYLQGNGQIKVEGQVPKGLLPTLRSITDLLRQWNQRLENGHLGQTAHSYSDVAQADVSSS